MKTLVICTGFIGDILLQSSVALKLHQQAENDIVPPKIDFLIPLAQPLMLLEENPHISNVYMPNLPNTPVIEHYDRIIQMPLVQQDRPATIQYQEAAGIKHTSVEYKIYTTPYYDTQAKTVIEDIRTKHPNTPLVAWQSNWSEKAYQTTPEQYLIKQGGPHRNIEKILSQLGNVILLEVGLPPGAQQAQNQNPDMYAYTASIIKQCDWMIGSEGGLTNLAAGVGTKCIITTDYIYQLYGKYGHVKQFESPQMGPATYFPTAGHIHLEPFISDDEVAKRISNIITGDQQ